jgi:hypothetical protein
VFGELVRLCPFDLKKSIHGKNMKYLLIKSSIIFFVGFCFPILVNANPKDDFVRVPEYNFHYNSQNPVQMTPQTAMQFQAAWNDFVRMHNKRECFYVELMHDGDDLLVLFSILQIPGEIFLPHPVSKCGVAVAYKINKKGKISERIFQR